MPLLIKKTRVPNLSPGRCKTCRNFLVKRFLNKSLLTYPYKLEYVWWCPLCGKFQKGNVLTGLNEKELAMAEWKILNGIPEKEIVDEDY